MFVMLFTYLDKQTVLCLKESTGVTGTGFTYLCHLHITGCHNM